MLHHFNRGVITKYRPGFHRVNDAAIAPAPGFEPGSEAPQASRISKLPHTGKEERQIII